MVLLGYFAYFSCLYEINMPNWAKIPKWFIHRTDLGGQLDLYKASPYGWGFLQLDSEAGHFEEKGVSCSLVFW